MERIIFVNWKWEDLSEKSIQKKINSQSLLVFSNFMKEKNGIEGFSQLIKSMQTQFPDGYFLIFTHKNENSNHIKRIDLQEITNNKTQIIEFEGGRHLVYFKEETQIGFINDTDWNLSNTWKQLKENIINNFESIWKNYWKEKQ